MIICRERDFFIDSLLVRIHLIVEMILVDRPCAMVSFAHTTQQRVWRSVLRPETVRMVRGWAVRDGGCRLLVLTEGRALPK